MRCVEVWKKFDPDLLMKLDWLKATAFVEVASAVYSERGEGLS